ncbi:uncharacterized protein LOC144070928 [Stigmatopora argus]
MFILHMEHQRTRESGSVQSCLDSYSLDIPAGLQAKASDCLWPRHKNVTSKAPRNGPDKPFNRRQGRFEGTPLSAPALCEGIKSLQEGTEPEFPGDRDNQTAITITAEEPPKGPPSLQVSVTTLDVHVQSILAGRGFPYWPGHFINAGTISANQTWHSARVVTPHSSEIEGSIPMWSLDLLPGPAWVFSGYSGFLPHPQNMHGSQARILDRRPFLNWRLHAHEDLRVNRQQRCDSEQRPAQMR